MAGTGMSAAMDGWSRRDTLVALVVATLLAVGLLAGVRPDVGGRPSAHPTPPRHPLPIRTIRVGASPSALALDNRTRRVFVVNQGTLDRSFVASGHGSVSVLDADSGTLLRTIPLGRQVYLDVPPAPRPLVVDERTGRVFLATSDVWPGQEDRPPPAPLTGHITMLDATTGAILRRIGVPAPPSRLAVDERTGRVFANTGQVLDARTGALIGHVAPGADVAVDAGIGRLFTVDGARLLIRDDATGRLLATVPIADAQAVVADTRHHRAVVGIVPSDDEYFNEDTAIVDTRTGHVLAGATGAHGDIWAVDGRAGRAIAVSTFTSNEAGSSISADIIDTRAGRVARHIDLDASLRPDVVIGVDEQRGHAVVVMSCCAPWLRNVAYVIGMRDGRILRQVVLGGGPPAIAVDAVTGHVYVTNLQDNTVSVLDTTHL